MSILSEILSFIRLNLTILIVLFLPGWLILRYFLAQEKFSWLEKTVLSLGLSLFFIDFFFIFFDRLGLNFFLGTKIFLIIIFSAGIFFLLQKNKFPSTKKVGCKLPVLFWLLLISSIIFRFFYLTDKVIPSSTDLGHHMYWAKSIIHFNHLPDYGMPDFIIGEHIVFALVSLLSGWNLISAMPMALLFLVNIFSLLALFVLAQKIFSRENQTKNHSLALLAFFAGGTLYAFSSPQTSFVSGGVVGNLLGNFFIPLILWLLLWAAKEKNKKIAVLSVLISATLAYTHHLSSYVFLFIFIFFFIFLLLNDLWQTIKKEKTFLFFSQDFLKTFFSWPVILAIFLFIGFVFFVQPPSYLNKAAIDTAMGDPSKDTRTGYSWSELAITLGDWRFYFGLIGFLSLVVLLIANFFPKKIEQAIKKIFPLEENTMEDRFSHWLILAWSLSLFLLSWVPQWLKTDIPSRRIVSYLSWPAALLTGISLFLIFSLAQKKLQKKAAFWLVFIFLAAGLFSSNQESEPYLLFHQNNSEAYDTFSASQYLAEISLPEEQILKDHIYLKGDTWVKLFLMRGYNTPLSRSNLSRYNDTTKPRETCTRDIIANPENFQGKQCLQDTQVRYVLLAKNKDDQNFKKSPAWSKIFSNKTTLIFFLNYASKN